MSLLDELRSLYGQDDQDEEERRLEALLAAEPPEFEPPALDPAVISATTDDMSQPVSGTEQQQAGHPDVLSFVKELEETGRLTSKTEEPTAPKGMLPAQTTIKSEQGGVPADVRAQGVAVRGQAELDDAEIMRQRAVAQAEDMAQRAAYKRQDVEIENEARQRAEAENAARQERLRAQQMELATQKDEPIDGSRYFKNMGALAKMSALLSAGIYGYLGGRGQPPVTETLMQMAKEDVAIQMSERAANRDRRNVLIDQYERQYGDTTLVAKRLEADKLHTLAKKADAEAMDAKTQELKASAEDIAKKLRNRVGVLHQEIQEATFDKPVEVSTTYQRPKPAGGVDAFGQMKKALEMDKILEERGVPADAPERRAVRKIAGIDEKTLGESKPVTEQGQQVKKDIDQRRHTYSQEDRELADEEQAMVSALEALGGSYDPETGAVVTPKDMKGAGIGAAARGIPFTEASYAAEALSNLADVKQRQRSGAAAPVAEEQKLRKIAAGANAYDEASVKLALEQMARSLYARRQAAMVGAGEDVLSSVRSERGKLPKAPVVTPVTDKSRIQKALGR